MILMAASKRVVSYFYNHNKNLYNKFEFLENHCICLCLNCVGIVLEFTDPKTIFRIKHFINTCHTRIHVSADTM